MNEQIQDYETLTFQEVFSPFTKEQSLFLMPV